MDFGSYLARHFGQPTVEASLHPHSDSERAELFQAFDDGSTEVEVLNFLHALVRLFKPRQALETGTYLGFGTCAIAVALKQNGLGHLHTVDVDAGFVATAHSNLGRIDPSLSDLATFHVANTLAFMAGWGGPPFDFVFFDSDIAIRHIELNLLVERDLLAAGALCCFHDTSRVRQEYFPGLQNQRMTAFLDQASQGRQWLECGFSRGFRLIKFD